jgi:alginate O-acetyltransferase complex protein AlgI
MLFNSISYGIFLPIVFILYWFITKNIKTQNILLLVSSYFFYACWDWRFLFLLAFSTLLDYLTGLKIAKEKERKLKLFWLWLSITINLGFLGVFKYYNFFVLSFADLISNFGLHANPQTLNVILPVGISFYTFHGLSYIIDVYKERIDPERNIFDYSLFVSFFPLLVAGPIERATHLLPQLKRNRVFEYSKAVDGLRQILWGLFKKIVLADTCAIFANLVFDNPQNYYGSDLVLGAFFFAFQIYGDFSGYSDIAIGTARLLGIDLLRNFAFPYFSRDIAEFWRRWHISLSSWFRDYVYIPLGGSKVGVGKKIRNTFIIFLISGFWHGANWTFITWGLLHAIYIIPSVIFKTNRNNLDIVAAERSFPNLKEISSMILTFSLIVFAWIFFRSDTLKSAFDYITYMFSYSLLSVPTLKVKSLMLLLFVFIIIEWAGRRDMYAIERLGLRWFRPFRWIMYFFIVLMIFCNGGSDQQFIYFQF